MMIYSFEFMEEAIRQLEGMDGKPDSVQIATIRIILTKMLKDAVDRDDGTFASKQFEEL